MKRKFLKSSHFDRGIKTELKISFEIVTITDVLKKLSFVNLSKF